VSGRAKGAARGKGGRRGPIYRHLGKTPRKKWSRAQGTTEEIAKRIKGGQNAASGSSSMCKKKKRRARRNFLCAKERKGEKKLREDIRKKQTMLKRFRGPKRGCSTGPSNPAVGEERLGTEEENDHPACQPKTLRTESLNPR